MVLLREKERAREGCGRDRDRYERERERERERHVRAKFSTRPFLVLPLNTASHPQMVTAQLWKGNAIAPTPSVFAPEP